mgnify:CR=1 FL=1
MKRLAVVTAFSLLSFTSAYADDTPQQVASKIGTTIADQEFATPEYAQEVKEQGSGEYMARRCKEAFKSNETLQEVCFNSAKDEDAGNFQATLPPRTIPTVSFVEFLSDGDAVMGKTLRITGTGQCVPDKNFCMLSTREILNGPGGSNLPAVLFGMSGMVPGSALRKQAYECSDVTRNLCHIEVTGKVIDKKGSLWRVQPTAIYIQPPEDQE